MRRATHLILPPDERITGTAATITLPRAERYRRRLTMCADDGTEFLLDLPEPTYMPDGAGLLLDDGGVILVRAADEPLMRISAPDRLTLARITWHIGNRHTPAEITEDALFIQPDHVLADMARGLGGTIEDVSRPFEPEGGAYGGHGSLEPGHHHMHGHHSHGHEH